MEQTSVLLQRVLESNHSLCEIHRSCVDIKCISRKTQQGIGARSRENVLGDVCSRSDRTPLASSLQRTFNAAWLGNRVAADLESKSRRNKCSSELRIARPNS